MKQVFINMKVCVIQIILLIVVGLVVLLDVNLIFRVQNFHINEADEYINDNYTRIIDEYRETYISCDINPICNITVKGLMTDHINFYILSPLSSVINNRLKLEKFHESFINVPNLISITHACIGLLSGFFLASRYLKYRRIGVLLFEFRTLLDNLGKLKSIAT